VKPVVALCKPCDWAISLFESPALVRKLKADQFCWRTMSSAAADKPNSTPFVVLPLGFPLSSEIFVFSSVYAVNVSWCNECSFPQKLVSSCCSVVVSRFYL